MKILACIDVGDSQVKEVWDLKDDLLIIRQVGDKAIAIRLEESRIQINADINKVVEQFNQTPKNKEHGEAINDSIERFYLGTLNISNAILYPLN